MSTPTYVRLTNAQLVALNEISADYSLKNATLIRCAVQRFLHQFAHAKPAERAQMLHEMQPRVTPDENLKAAIRAVAHLGLDPVAILTTAAEQALTTEATA